MLCSACGSPIEASAPFCYRCGASLGAAPNGTDISGAVVPLAPAPPSPLTLRDALSRATRAAFPLFGPLLATQGILIVLGAALNVWIDLTWIRPKMEAMAGLLDPLAMLAASGSMMLFVLGAAIVGLVLQAIGLVVGITVFDAAQLGQRLGIGQAWREAIPRVGNMVLTISLLALAVLGVLSAGLLLSFLIVPVFLAVGFVLYLLVRWALFAPVSLFEPRSPAENLRRAAALSKGSRLTIFRVAMVLVLVGTVPSSIINIAMRPEATIDPLADPAGAYREQLPSTPVLLASAAVGLVFQLVTSFIATAFVVQTYRHLAPAPAP